MTHSVILLPPIFFHWTKKSSYFDLRNWVTVKTKISPEIPSNWRILLIYWTYYIYHKLLGIPGRILVPLLTQSLRSKWLNFFFQCSITSAQSNSKIGCKFQMLFTLLSMRLWWWRTFTPNPIGIGFERTFQVESQICSIKSSKRDRKISSRSI